MSQNKYIIEITPPALIGPSNMTENISIPGHLCSYCQGNGFHWSEICRERTKISCPVCKGSGRLDVTVNIEWKPAK